MKTMLLSSLVALSFLLHPSVSMTAGQEVNDLNAALKHVIGEMNSEQFFTSTYTEYFESLPSTVPNECSGSPAVDIEFADESLTQVIEDQVLRIGLVKSLASVPMYYAVTGASDNETVAVEQAKEISLDLGAGTLEGYEIVCAKEAVRRLSIQYGVEIEAEFIFVDDVNESFLDGIQSALDNREVDVVWSGIYVTEGRGELMDFVCPSFLTDIVIAVGPGVSNEMPDPNGPEVKLGCTAFTCYNVVPPAPFVLVDMGSSAAIYDALADPEHEVDYIMVENEELYFLIKDVCNECQTMNSGAIVSVQRAPATRRVKEGDYRGASKPMEVVDEKSAAASFRIKEHSLFTLFVATSFASIYSLL